MQTDIYDSTRKAVSDFNRETLSHKARTTETINGLLSLRESIDREIGRLRQLESTLNSIGGSGIRLHPYPVADHEGEPEAGEDDVVDTDALSRELGSNAA